MALYIKFVSVRSSSSLGELQSFRNYYEWNGHLEVFSRPQTIENSRQYLVLEQIFYRKQSLGAPDVRHVSNGFGSKEIIGETGSQTEHYQ